MKKYTILFGAICAVTLAFSLNAKASEIGFTSILDVSNLPPGNPGPYGTVDVTLSGQTATITFTAATGYFFGDGSSAGVELNTDSFTEAFVSESPSNNFKQFTFDKNVDGFGSFDLTLDQKNFAVHLTSITFTVTNTGTPWATDADVLVANEKGWDAVAHVFSTSSGKTGFAAESGGGNTHVPDSGATAMLLGSALAGLGLVRRYLKR